MRKFLLGIVIGAFAFHAYQRINHPEPPRTFRPGWSLDPDLKWNGRAGPPTATKIFAAMDAPAARR